MNIRNFSAITFGSALLLSNLCAAEPVPPPAAPPAAPPVIAPGHDSPRKVLSEQHKRRYEIMVLIQAYRILPAEQQPAVKAAILERLKQDCVSHNDNLKKMIARTEKTLDHLKNELAKPVDAKAEAELERLLNAPIGDMGPHGWRKNQDRPVPPVHPALGKRHPKRPERPERPERLERPERPERPQRPDSRNPRAEWRIPGVQDPQSPQQK